MILIGSIYGSLMDSVILSRRSEKEYCECATQ